jgi:hypothetical protein
MTTSPGSTVAGEAMELEPFHALAELGQIETDYYCGGCGYNLHRQAVRRDPRTQILLCRCSECGRYHEARLHSSAGSVWLQRLGKLGLGLWVLLLIGALAIIGMIQLVLIVEAHYMLARPSRGYGPGGTEAELQIMKMICAAVSFALGYVACLVAVVAMPHWRREGYLAFIVVFAMLILAAAVVYVHFEHVRTLGRWGILVEVCSFTLSLTIIGGIIAAFTGRPLTRLVVMLFVTPRLRPMLGYLWTADGKAAPGAVGARRRGAGGE